MLGRNRTASFRTVVLAAILLAPPLGARQEAEFAEEIEVTEVLLDVLVTDKSGRVILGLGTEDFAVHEGKDAVELTGVTFYSSRELLGSMQALESRGMSVDEMVEERYFVLFFQQQRRAAADVPGLLSRQLGAGRDAVEWLRRDLQTRDFAAVAVFETRLEIVQDFTNNVEDLERAIRVAVQGQGTKGNWPSRQQSDEGTPSLLRHLPTGKDLRRSSRNIYETLQLLASAAGEVRGRKILIFFGRGIGEMNDFGVWEPDSRYYGTTVETLNDNNVAVYPLSVMPSGSRHTLEQSLQALAAQTGGVFHRQFTSFTTPLVLISDENGGYYLLSYQSRRSRGGSGFQRVEVTVRNPELTVRARRGYRYGDSPRAEPE